MTMTPPYPGPLTCRQDFAASLVVFLVALPLCVGVAVASGVPGRTRPGHRHRGRSRHRADAGQQPPGVRARRRADRAGLRGRAGVRAARARGIVLAAGLLQVAMGALKPGPLVPGHLGVGRRGHAGRNRARAHRRSAVRGGRAEGAGRRARQDRRTARPAGERGRNTAALASLALGAAHHRRARAVAAAAAGRGRCRRPSPRWSWRPLATLVFDLPVAHRRGAGPARTPSSRRARRLRGTGESGVSARSSRSR